MGELVSSPIRGNDGLHFTLAPTPGAAVEYEGHVKKIGFAGEDKDDLTFLEVMTGDTKIEGVTLTIVQSFKAGSLFRLLHDNPAGSFDAVIGLGGNAVPSADKPHIEGRLKANGRPTPSSEARTTRNREEVEVSLTFEEPYTINDGV